MKKNEFIGRVYDMLHDTGAKKPVAIPKQKYTITDDAGNSRQFTIKRQDGEAYYTMEDIKKVFRAIIAVTIDSMRHGDTVYIPNIGTLSFSYRKATKCKLPGKNEWVDVPAHYVPKMQWAKSMRNAARIFEAYMIENTALEEPVRIKRKRGRPRRNNPISELTDQIEAGLARDEMNDDLNIDIDDLIDEMDDEDIEDEEALDDVD